MSDEIIINHCSPTLAGLKTANLFTCPPESKAEIRDFIRTRNKMLSNKGLRILPLRFDSRGALIYVYRPGMLEKDLKASETKKFLKSLGYRTETPESCIFSLIGRLSKSKEFPHEIGFFLGYPPEDVFGFIHNNASDFKSVGYWKVYGDENKAQKTFDKYKKCKKIYLKEYSNGIDIERLTVAG